VWPTMLCQKNCSRMVLGYPVGDNYFKTLFCFNLLHNHFKIGWHLIVHSHTFWYHKSISAQGFLQSGCATGWSPSLVPILIWVSLIKGLSINSSLLILFLIGWVITGLGFQHLLSLIKLTLYRPQHHTE